MTRVLIIDDEPLARQLIRSLLQAHADISVVGEAVDGLEGFKAIQDLKPDLVFLDVQMPRVSGIEMINLLDAPPAVIFVTAFDEYAVSAFEAHAVDYLVKPVSPERFRKALQRWKERKPSTQDLSGLSPTALYRGYQHRIVVRDRQQIRIIPLPEILHLEADDDYVRITTGEGTFLKKTSLSALESELDPGLFVRVHRSWMIPVSGIARIEPYEKESHLAVLHCGARVPVSRSGYARLKEVLRW